MITGMHYDLTSEEILTHFLERARHHEARAKFYEERLVLWTATEVPAPVATKMSSYNVDPAEDFRNKVKSHKAKAARLLFLAKHLVPKETYRLTKHEISEYDFIDM